MMGEDLLRIGELASRAGVSTRTVDFYTGLGLLTPIRRSGGNFRLYQPADVQRIAAVRHLEAQGIRLEDIAHVLTAATDTDHSDCTDRYQGPCPADPVALTDHLTALEVKVRELTAVAEAADPQTRSVLATLAARAQALMAAALLLSTDLLPAAEQLPPF